MAHYAQFDMILLYGPSEIHCYNSNRGGQEVLTSTWHSELQGDEVKLGMFPFPSLESAYIGFTSFYSFFGGAGGGVGVYTANNASLYESKTSLVSSNEKIVYVIIYLSINLQANDIFKYVVYLCIITFQDCYVISNGIYCRLCSVVY